MPPTYRLASSTYLFARVRAGDSRARDELAVRYLGALRRFAHGRLPLRARSLKDTEDLVQDAVTRALEHFDTFSPSRQGAFLSYLRQIVLNQVRDEVRRAAHRFPHDEPPDNLPATGTSPLEQAIGTEAVEIYEAALSRLSHEQREAVILRIELGLSYEQIAEALAKSSTGSARMTVQRAVARMAIQMRSLRETS